MVTDVDGSAALQRSKTFSDQDMKKVSFQMVKDNDGDFLDSYELGACIGKGTLGEVRVCIHKIS